MEPVVGQALGSSGQVAHPEVAQRAEGDPVAAGGQDRAGDAVNRVASRFGERGRGRRLRRAHRGREAERDVAVSSGGQFPGPNPAVGGVEEAGGRQPRGCEGEHVLVRRGHDRPADDDLRRTGTLVAGQQAVHPDVGDRAPLRVPAGRVEASAGGLGEARALPGLVHRVDDGVVHHHGHPAPVGRPPRLRLLADGRGPRRDPAGREVEDVDAVTAAAVGRERDAPAIR